MRFAVAVLVVAAACDATSPESPDAAVGGGLRVARVEWFHRAPCRRGSHDDVYIRFEVTGGTAPYSYTGGAELCEGDIMSNPARIACAEIGVHRATATITDAVGATATAAFDIYECTPGSTTLADTGK